MIYTGTGCVAAYSFQTELEELPLIATKPPCRMLQLEDCVVGDANKFANYNKLDNVVFMTVYGSYVLEKYYCLNLYADA